MADLPSGYRLRHPTRADATAVTDVVVAGDVADFGEPDFTQSDLLDDWDRPRFELDRDAWVVTGPTGRVVAYAYVWECQPGREVESDAFVLPEYGGRGIGGRLLDEIESRAHAVAGEAGVPVELGLYASIANQAKRDLLTRRGFRAVRTSLRLKVDLSQQRLDPVPAPDGVVIRAFDPAQDEDAVRDCMADAYAEHHRYTPRRMDEWLDIRLRHPAFDPQLWRVAVADGQVVGAVHVYDVGGTGYVSNVGLREAWRGQGLGQALLRDALGALRERGQLRCLVSLDADATPAAISLYEAAGMRVHERHDWFTKPVAP